MGSGRFFAWFGRWPGRLADAEGKMASKSSYIIGGLAIVSAMIVALPAAQSIAATNKDSSIVQVNRSAKGDRLAAHGTKAVKQAPQETAHETVRTPSEPTRRKIMEGCDPMFSPVTMPSMAHLAGRCVG